MANIFFTGEKDSKEQAIKSVSDFIKDYSECVFEAVLSRMTVATSFR